MCCVWDAGSGGGLKRGEGGLPLDEIGKRAGELIRGSPEMKVVV